MCSCQAPCAGFPSHRLAAGESKVGQLSSQLQEAKNVLHAKEEQLKTFKQVHSESIEHLLGLAANQTFVSSRCAYGEESAACH